jgi:hypothetical protein
MTAQRKFGCIEINRCQVLMLHRVAGHFSEPRQYHGLSQRAARREELQFNLGAHEFSSTSQLKGEKAFRFVGLNPHFAFWFRCDLGTNLRSADRPWDFLLIGPELRRTTRSAPCPEEVVTSSRIFSIVPPCFGQTGLAG